MNRSYTVNMKTRKGKVMKMVRELYLRDFISCNSDVCDSCELEAGEKITLSADPFNHEYLIPDAEVLVNQEDLLQQEIPPLCDVIILQSVLLEVRKRSISVFNQVSTLLRNSSKRWVFFANQNFERTYLDRQMEESIDDYNVRLLVTATQYFYEHFKSYEIVPMVLTNTVQQQTVYSKHSHVSCMTITEFVDSLREDYSGLSDHLNLASIETADPSMIQEGDIPASHYDPVKRQYILSKEQGANVIYYNYLDDEIIKQGLESGRLFKGIYHSNPDNIWEGHVTIHTSTSEKSVLIKGRDDINRSIDGDQVIIEVYPKSGWKSESAYLIANNTEEEAEEAKMVEEENSDRVMSGRVVGIARRNWRSYCGSIEPIAEGHIQGYVLFDPVNSRIPKIRLKTSQYNRLLNQRIVVAIDDWTCSSRYPVGHYLRSLGPIGDREVETQVLLLEHDIPPNVFSKEVLDCLPPADWKITEENSRGRVDLRENCCIVSIDPPGCKDIDDALHARDLPNGHIEVGIHIADVSYYIKHDSPLDQEARNRSTSTYLVDRRLDMLPKLLTENLCSLVGGEDRFAFSVIVEMNDEAEVLNQRFVKTIIRSRKAMSYGEAQSYLDNGDNTSEIGHSIHLLYSLSRKLKQRRINAGALNLASPEVHFEMDNERQDPLSLDAYKLHETNSLVEEFMLLANCLVAKRIVDAYPKLAILRRHPVPDKTRFESLIKIARNSGFELNCDSNKELADSLDKAVIPDRPYYNRLLRILVTRCMTQAVYFPSGEVSPELYYHYGKL
ncbi:hypothetical protein JH06_4221 [Blastocystis sp. subtype 4]|uniref:hypothetical protein n=1 Tax=Blastocystis sp. subtype 4 TaxID=944170 RepID=UPI000711705C|nr:hypothetical protein JH06_4221 [Blastocystis sp. subtype 4]KNB43110.1 hypothetical protein JH06_4221 [Blastocystis sp. subtype 4]|eukprot:XP_014526553.1 hypothetical protein JH06_4221 [Blastocystis sp. subtype 4]